jgi:hypothetical protein
MEDTHRFEAIITHLTAVMFALLSIATWLLRWVVGSWTARARVADAYARAA